MTFSVEWSHFGVLALKRIAEIRSSNVDKVIDPDELPIRLCNYVDVYYNEFIGPDLDLSIGSAKPGEIERFGLKANDVIITKDSETPDDIAVAALVICADANMVCGYHLALLRPDDKKIMGRFLFYALKAKPVREAFSIRAQGITRFGLTLAGIGSVACPIPDLDTQKAITAFLDNETSRIDRIIRAVSGQAATKMAMKGTFLSLLLERRAALITAAVTGQIDVTTWGKQVQADRRLDEIQEVMVHG
jgi:restriction endonuclease S subunit